MANKNVTIKKRNASNTGWDEMYPVTTAENVKCGDGSSVETQLGDIANKQGNLTTLQTIEKTNLVGAVNELFTFADSGKINIKNKIQEVDSSIALPDNPTFNDLVTAIGNISTGKKWASGSLSIIFSSNTYTINNLDFTPSFVIFTAWNSYGISILKENSSGSNWNLPSNHYMQIDEDSATGHYFDSVTLSSNSFSVKIHGNSASTTAYWVALE